MNDPTVEFASQDLIRLVFKKFAVALRWGYLKNPRLIVCRMTFVENEIALVPEKLQVHFAQTDYEKKLAKVGLLFWIRKNSWNASDYCFSTAPISYDFVPSQVLCSLVVTLWLATKHANKCAFRLDQTFDGKFIKNVQFNDINRISIKSRSKQLVQMKTTFETKLLWRIDSFEAHFC